MKKRAIIAIGILTVLILTTISGCTSPIGWVTEAFDGAYNADANTVLEVKNINGDVEVDKWDGDKIDLHAVKKVKEDKEDELDDVEIVVTEQNNSVVIETVRHRLDVDVTVTMTIKVPSLKGRTRNLPRRSTLMIHLPASCFASSPPRRWRTTQGRRTSAAMMATPGSRRARYSQITSRSGSSGMAWAPPGVPTPSPFPLLLASGAPG